MLPWRVRRLFHSSNAFLNFVEPHSVIFFIVLFSPSFLITFSLFRYHRFGIMHVFIEVRPLYTMRGEWGVEVCGIKRAMLNTLTNQTAISTTKKSCKAS